MFFKCICCGGRETKVFWGYDIYVADIYVVRHLCSRYMCVLISKMSCFFLFRYIRSSVGRHLCHIYTYMSYISHICVFFSAIMWLWHFGWFSSDPAYYVIFYDIYVATFMWLGRHLCVLYVYVVDDDDIRKVLPGVLATTPLNTERYDRMRYLMAFEDFYNPKKMKFLKNIKLAFEHPKQVYTT